MVLSFLRKSSNNSNPEILKGYSIKKELEHPEFHELYLCYDEKRQQEVVIGTPSVERSENIKEIFQHYIVGKTFSINLDRHYSLEVKKRFHIKNKCYILLYMKRRYIKHYEILYQRDQGSMGTIYKVKDSKQNAIFALKEIGTEDKPNQTMQRAIQESSILKNLDHRHILKVHNTFTWKKTMYLVMEYVTGENLQDLIERGPIAPKLSLQSIKSLAQALAHIHAENIIHRDIKPANIMLDNKLQPKLMDFGIAKVMHYRGGQLSSAPDITMAGEMVGTPRYMAPELINIFSNPKAKYEFDEKIDIFALGVTLAEMLFGYYPFSQKTNHLYVFWSLVNDPTPQLEDDGTDITRSINDLLRDMMAKDPQERIADMNAVVERIDEIIHQFKAKTTKVIKRENPNQWSPPSRKRQKKEKTQTQAMMVANDMNKRIAQAKIIWIAMIIFAVIIAIIIRLLQ